MKGLVFLVLISLTRGGAASSCTKCQEDMKSFRNDVLDQLNQESVMSQMQQMCASHSVQENQLCIQALEEHMPVLLDHLKSVDAEQVCFAMGQCSEEEDTTLLRYGDVSVTNTSIRDLRRSMFCAVCTTSMGLVHNVLADKRFQKILFKTLWNVCRITGPFVKRCRSLLMKYGKMAFELAKEELTPELCKVFGVCEGAQPIQDLVVLHRGGWFCSICKRITSKVHALIHDKYAKQRLIALTKWMCGKLPPPFNVMTLVDVTLSIMMAGRFPSWHTTLLQRCVRAGKDNMETAPNCDGFASLVLPQLFDYLRSNCQILDNLCKILRICPSEQIYTQRDLVALHRGGWFCSKCKRITSTVNDLIHGRDAKQRLVVFTKWMCGKLPSRFNAMCNGFPSWVLLQLFDYLRSNCEIIGNLCKVLRICPSDQISIQRGMM